jgi:glycosyltransferase involved in cell wall biosynthesis
VNIVLLLAHSIEEYDQLRLLSGLGYDVFSIGGYIDPAHPHDSKRPALPDVPYHPDLHAAVDALGTDDNLRFAKEVIPDAVLDWADAIICHHYEHAWLVPQWNRLRGRRVIWRTVGQSVEGNERMMAPLRDDGLQIVRYSPKERNIPGYAGEDALIRFYKDPDEWHGWTGESPQVLNITQHLRQREPYTNWGFWEAATAGLNRVPAGPGSEDIGGTGEVSFPVMKELLREMRCYLYTGTQPASYTLGLIEAMMTGLPVISIGPSHMRIFPYGHLMFEGHEITRLGHDLAAGARGAVVEMLNDWDVARSVGAEQRKRAIDLFGMETIGKQWAAFLGE